MAPRVLKVLLVEDDEDDYLITRDLFSEIQSKTYDVEWVDSYDAGRQAISRHEHDIYLIDYRLGIQNGLELLREAVTLGCAAPIILLTGLGDSLVDLAAMEAGAADYLVKGQINGLLLERSISHSLQRKLAERKLRESEEHYRLLFEQNPHPMWVAELITTRILSANHSAAQHYGFSEREFLAMRIQDFEAGAQSGQTYLTGETSDSFNGTHQHRKKNGDIIVVELTSNNLIFRGKAAALVLANDITKRLDLESQLRQSQKMESMGTLAGGIAHDFNNILAIISSYSSLLIAEKENEDKLARNVQAIEQAVERGANLVRQILTFARKTDVLWESIQINSVIQELVKLLTEAFPRTISFRLNLDHRLPELRADPTQLHQTLLNLCVNARDAMPEGGVLAIKTEIVSGEELRRQFPEAEGETFACVSMTDTGTGMDEKTRSHIFEPFFTTKARDRGTGLGLAVVYGIVKGHHGFIDVSSEQGRGTTFRVYLPFRKDSVGAREKTKSPELEARGGMETILFVEDEQLLRELMTSVLESKGYRVLCARDGIEAVELFSMRHAEIKLVLSDVGLPRLGGWEAFLEMKQIAPGVKTILASGYLEPEIKAKILAAGARDFVQKPYSPKEVCQRIRNVLDQPV